MTIQEINMLIVSFINRGFTNEEIRSESGIIARIGDATKKGAYIDFIRERHESREFN